MNFRELLNNIPKEVNEYVKRQNEIAYITYLQLKRSGLTQELFAKKLGITELELTRTLSGQKELSMKAKMTDNERVIDTLKSSLIHLYECDNSPYSDSEIIDKLLDTLHLFLSQEQVNEFFDELDDCEISQFTENDPE
jgi:transcriptional regulator with XRE-family HTH domain